jgi:hypothetical protein
MMNFYLRSSVLWLIAIAQFTIMQEADNVGKPKTTSGLAFARPVF